jgi:hypothetical protein
VVTVGVEGCRGGLATCARAGQWCSGRTPARQLLTGRIPGEAKVSTAQGDPK